MSTLLNSKLHLKDNYTANAWSIHKIRKLLFRFREQNFRSFSLSEITFKVHICWSKIRVKIVWLLLKRYLVPESWENLSCFNLKIYFYFHFKTQKMVFSILLVTWNSRNMISGWKIYVLFIKILNTML